MVFFPVPGANFDLASFSFQVPICGLAKQSVPAAKHSARVSSDVFVFMSLFQTGIGRAVNIFSNKRNFSSRIDTSAALFLVPKLHLGTHLSRQLYCLRMVIICYAERSKASKTSSVPKCNLGTRRRGAQFWNKELVFSTPGAIGGPALGARGLWIAATGNAEAVKDCPRRVGAIEGVEVNSGHFVVQKIVTLFQGEVYPDAAD